MDIYIKGQFRKSIFQSDNGYIIGLFKVSETNDENIDIYVDRTITFTGYFHELNEVDTYIFYGKLVDHNKYGEQFQVEKYERCMPDDKNGIVDFLSSGLFKGIGEAKAKKIEKVLGKDTFKVILENPSNLVLIPG
ncbi:MAG: ATP-dependent RecD-like DNA helicase, partial [Bacilli bacterium]|nr:ATP-dependent RecD-like DNA helicase [Bacilli bacterium]